jgi:outer membrane biogenesis lipoprotein LolB
MQAKAIGTLLCGCAVLLLAACAAQKSRELWEANKGKLVGYSAEKFAQCAGYAQHERDDALEILGLAAAVMVVSLC